MPDPADELRAQQLAFAAYVRDPEACAAPPGVEDRRLRVYRDLFFNGIGSLLAGNFPVIRRTLPDADWRALVRAFYAHHRCTTPLFTEVGGEFVGWLATRDPASTGDPPWLAELAHYEWIELALQVSDRDRGDVDPQRCNEGTRPRRDAGDPDLREAPLRLSPLARPLAYAWPVHRIGPGWRPAEAPGTPTLLLARRDDAGDVRFSELSPLVFRLLQLIECDAATNGHQALALLAGEAGAAGDDRFHAEGAAMLQRLFDEGTVVRALC